LIARLAQAAVDALALTPLRNATVLSLVFVVTSAALFQRSRQHLLQRGPAIIEAGIIEWRTK